MKTKLLNAAVLLVGILLIQPATVLANPHLLGVEQSTCGHVIDLLLRYGTTPGGETIALPDGHSLILGSSIGDLELSSVTMVEPGSDVAGPTILVTVCNKSVRDISSFSVSAVAVLGRIHPLSPSTTQRVERICAGENVELRLCLPLECLAMGRAGADTLAFRKLVVAIDSFDELVESNESNNLLVIDREAIPVAVPVEPTTEVPEAPTVSPAEPVHPATPNPESRIDDLDFEKLEIKQ